MVFSLLCRMTREVNLAAGRKNLRWGFFARIFSLRANVTWICWGNVLEPVLGKVQKFKTYGEPAIRNPFGWMDRRLRIWWGKQMAWPCTHANSCAGKCFQLHGKLNSLWSKNGQNTPVRCFGSGKSEENSGKFFLVILLRIHCLIHSSAEWRVPYKLGCGRFMCLCTQQDGCGLNWICVYFVGFNPDFRHRYFCGA